MLARTPARHARRCDATANTRVRLFPNVSVCGCVVRRGDDHRSGAERCVPAPGSRGIFQVQVETNSHQCTRRTTFAKRRANLISCDENFGPAGALRSLLGAHPQAVSPFVVMGKKSASKDRGYITATEWKLDGGGYRDKSEGLPFRRLPFNCCAVSFVPFEDPVCAPDGTVMDIMHAVPYVQKHGKHPVTGEPLELKDLTKLTFHKNQEGAYECPVLNKAFTNSTHIVAVKTTGNVYSHQAIEELCAKPKNWRDLLTDEKFSRKDLVTIQDPMNLAGRAVDRFEHVVRGHDVAPARAPTAPPAPPQPLRLQPQKSPTEVLKECA